MNLNSSLGILTTAQYKYHKGQSPLCIDTDPVNPTFHGFKSLKVERLNIMEGDEINPRCFDELIERIANSTQDVQEIIFLHQVAHARTCYFPKNAAIRFRVCTLPYRIANRNKSV